MVSRVPWAQGEIVRRDGSVMFRIRLEGGTLDLSVVDRVARLRLATKRRGCRLVLERVSPELAVLLDFVGLPFEAVGKPERLEERNQITEREEEAEGSDLLS